MKKENKYVCPVKRRLIKVNERLEVLLLNTLTFLNTEYLAGLTLNEKLEIVINELGFTEEDITDLNLIEEVFGEDGGESC